VEAVTAAAPTTLDAETQLVRAGVSALHAGDAAEALAAFDQHARLYPTGFLAEERSGERVLALCDLGRKADASDAARAFLAAYPRSPLAARVRASCATPSNP
jgi:RNA polymerase sigma-70 factor (ECF subfamily)